MRRADRLYQITLFLRSRPLTTARWLAQALHVSERTIYRDIADLMCTGLDIEGEAGVGYRLKTRNELPPLSFGIAELDALRLGCRLVSQRGDAALALAARQALARIETALRDTGQPLHDTALYVPPIRCNGTLEALGLLREAIRTREVVHFAYTRADGTGSRRDIEPLGLFYWESGWTMVGWCRLRDDYRHFRLDRIRQLQLTGRHFAVTPGRNLADYLHREGIRPDRLD
ncbi:helix-turn-helix transcriptional regulator [Chitinilyticum piscinae]|uniref:YafY family transcriptional regulator n=1 Tax=Chitinilyticum piscinae TaxID=2866724 RepID=A0A8J7K1Y4_9NEIS|nr:YafY family protein [Chitinilyticum piscinae]MBE9609277.1 YafY family transcriptional regulator [Chitinilyticum piscinae]